MYVDCRRRSGRILGLNCPVVLPSALPLYIGLRGRPILMEMTFAVSRSRFPFPAETTRGLMQSQIVDPFS